MPSGTFNHVRVSGVVTCIPRDVRSIDDELDLYGGNVAQLERIKKTIGLGTRRVVSPGVTALDLCETAVQALMKDAALDPASVDGLIFVTQTPDHFQPANACILHGRLGLGTGCAAFDVNLGCSGWVYALWLASTLVESGQCSRIIVCAGDTISRQVNPRDRAVAPLFGDAGSATLIERDTAGRKSVFSLHTDGKGHRAIMVPAGGFRQPHGPESELEAADEEGNVRAPCNLCMSGAEVFNFSLKVEPEAIRELAALAGRPIEDLDWVFFHQANRYIIGNITRRLKLPAEKAPSGVVERFGNQSSASIPGVICDTLGTGGAGSGAGLTRAHEVAVSGFGVGLSWASAWLTLGPLVSCRIVEHAG
jgi:3-oxoacyl-[acyl-carrier-protein] synthase III